MYVYTCNKGHYLCNSYQPDDCYKCDDDNSEFIEVTDPLELMSLAEKENDNIENRHIYADAALYNKVRQIDETLAIRYENVRKSKSWYFA